MHGIRSLSGFGNLVRPLAQSVLYLHDSASKASPKAISGRTSYIRVRLAFHHYPQLISQFFNIGEFGPPLAFKQASPWPWVDHSVSGLRPATNAPYSDSLSLRLRKLVCLTSQQNVTRRPVLQKVRRHSCMLETQHPMELRLIVSIRFQVLFHSPPGVLFTFPSRYWFTIGCQLVFSLRRWASLIRTGSHVSRTTWDQITAVSLLSPTGLLPSVAGLSRPFG